jgi:FkbM family methyltransferase
MYSEPWLAPLAGAITSGQCRTALDVGANDGEWSLWLASRFERVVAIEPDDRCHNRATDHAVNVIEEHCAVGAKAGAGVLRQRVSTLQSSLLDVHPVGDAGRDVNVICISRVLIVTLDDLMFGHPSVDFVKIDIEGAEGDALAGALDPRWVDVRFLIESHDRREVVLNELARIGKEGVSIFPHPHPEAGKGHEWIWAA